ncbi:hypothetical protein FBU59_001347 [Linderina macrospora]|uniref:Uncharacterized protein n=1 Tax=Linderina macrospora TaxID=4868 RepID=A0ACC1JEK7_9FUNG|nr:hypothetical protein FBU59_001347 [Linderina macrospora]
MDVDEEVPAAKSELKSLFGGETTSTGGGLFGSSSGGGFKFTEALGLEEDEPSAIGKTIDEQAPVTGGATLDGPAIRNLNANRLPMFFADIDAPAFKQPEPVFQRQQTEDELNEQLDQQRADLTKEYKSQHRSVVKKSQKLRQRRAKGPGGN